MYNGLEEDDKYCEDKKSSKAQRVGTQKARSTGRFGKI